MADAWALFGDDDDGDASRAHPSKPQSAPPPRASTHPFFTQTRECWCFHESPGAVSMATADEPVRIPSTAYLTTSLNLEGRVPPLVKEMRQRNLGTIAESLAAMAKAQTIENASGVINAAVRALGVIQPRDVMVATHVNASILLARAVKADRALDASTAARMNLETAEEKTKTKTTSDDSLNDAFHDAYVAAMAAAEASVLLAECALLVDDPPVEVEIGGSRNSDNSNRQTVGRNWIGARVVAACSACARFEGKSFLETERQSRMIGDHESSVKRPRDGINESDETHLRGNSRTSLPKRLRRLPIVMDDPLKTTVDVLTDGFVSRGMSLLKTADRVDCQHLTSIKFYNEYVSRNKPVVIAGVQLRDGWTLSSEVRDLQKLATKHGAAPVPVEKGVQNYGGIDADQTTTYALLSTFLGEYFSEESDGEAEAETDKNRIAYVSQHSLLHQAQELQTHFSVPEYCFGRISAVNAWLGTAGTVTHLHTDGAENLLCQVCGYKLVCLFPPSVAKEVYCETRNGNGLVNQCACVWYFPNPGALFADCPYVHCLPINRPIQD